MATILAFLGVWLAARVGFTPGLIAGARVSGAGVLAMRARFGR